jgi:hypothetical protein
MTDLLSRRKRDRRSAAADYADLASPVTADTSAFTDQIGIIRTSA